MGMFCTVSTFSGELSLPRRASFKTRKPQKKRGKSERPNFKRIAVCRKQLQKIHEEPSDPRTQPTPRRHGQHRNRTHPGSHKNSRECSGPSRHAGSREGSRSDSQADHRENSRSTSHADDREGSRSAGHRHNGRIHADNGRIHADNGRIHADNGRIHADNGRDSKALDHRDSIEDTGSSGETDGSGESASTADTDCTGDSRGTRHRNKRPPESRTDSRAVPRTELAITPEALQMLDCVLNRSVVVENTDGVIAMVMVIVMMVVVMVVLPLLLLLHTADKAHTCFQNSQQTKPLLQQRR